LNSATTSRPGDAFSPYSAGMSVTKSSPPKAEGDSSPTSKLHRLLAESRQMVQNLEQSSTFSLTGSPKQVSYRVTPYHLRKKRSLHYFSVGLLLRLVHSCYNSHSVNTATITVTFIVTRDRSL